MSRSTAYTETWPQEQLSNVCEIEIGGTPARGNPRFWARRGEAGFPWVAISDMGPERIDQTAEQITQQGVNNSSTKLVPEGTILMSFKLTIGRTAVADTDLYTNEAIAAFYPISGRLADDWLYHILPQAAEQGSAEQAVKGKTLSKTKLQKLKIPVPPLAEQRRIAEILDAADEAIRQSEHVIAKLQEVRKGLLHDLLTRGLDRDGNLRDPDAHPKQFKDSPLGRVPREWEIADLDALGTWRGGSTPSKSEPANWNEGTVIWLSPKDLKNSRLSTSEDKITEYALSSSGLTIFDPGDVVVVFRSGILRHSFPVAVTDVPFTVNQDLKVLIPDSSVDRALAFWLLEGMGSLILNKAVKAGTTVESIDPYAFYHLPVALPSPEEQRRIAPILNAEDVRIQAEVAALEKLRQVKRGLMDDLLTGHVRV